MFNLYTGTENNVVIFQLRSVKVFFVTGNSNLMLRKAACRL